MEQSTNQNFEKWVGTEKLIRLDACYHHPFTSIIASPTQYERSTFVYNLLLHMEDLINAEVDYITHSLGREVKDDKVLVLISNVYDKKDRCRAIEFL